MTQCTVGKSSEKRHGEISNLYHIFYFLFSEVIKLGRNCLLGRTIPPSAGELQGQGYEVA